MGERDAYVTLAGKPGRKRYLVDSRIILKWILGK
jgi:hypothetical protein